jgi:hypothetical protein
MTQHQFETAVRFILILMAITFLVTLILINPLLAATIVIAIVGGTLIGYFWLK